MKIVRTEIEVRYQETDQMGVVYHGNYLVWFEIGRTKYIEELGFTYAAMESHGFVSPVTNAHISYKKPVRYGERVFIDTWVERYDGLRTVYRYNICNEAEDIVVTGETEHVIVNKESFRPVPVRKYFPAWHEAYSQQLRGE